MKPRLVSLLSTVAVSTLIMAGCAQSTPPPAPTQVPAAPTKAAEPAKAAAPTAQPTAAPAPQPTAVPAKKVDFPIKGKAITLIAPYAAGGPSDIMARVLAPFLEKGLGTPVEVVNKPGASSQVGITELAKSKPDGHTIGTYNLPTALTLYLDPDKQAAFSRKDLQPLAVMIKEPGVMLVKADAPYKGVKDVIDAAKAKPGGFPVGTSGALGITHLAAIQLEKLAGVKFAPVHFDGAAPSVTALLGGHVEAVFGNVNVATVSPIKSGTARGLGVMSKEEHKNVPGAKTFEAQGYALYSENYYTWGLPAGVPKDVLEILSAAFKKASQDADVRKKLDDAGMGITYMDHTQYAALLDQMEPEVKQLLEAAKQQMQK